MRPAMLSTSCHASENDKFVQTPPHAKQSTSTIFNHRLSAVSLSLSRFQRCLIITSAQTRQSTPGPNNVGLNNLQYSVRHNGVSESRRLRSTSSILTRRLQSRSTAQVILPHPNPACQTNTTPPLLLNSPCSYSTPDVNSLSCHLNVVSSNLWPDTAAPRNWTNQPILFYYVQC
ncbi:hypothetical protein Hypma_001883 [Hypsizygus marmoreus]|uniref:Uncharacterized protein n=1 Tax=Hypsizygus marmoreus TaxID=39966 RepID=A0A369JE53_HYPMA|nr:hypothetical protein Hypma_001883 [Hypsizygus marmoreus]